MPPFALPRRSASIARCRNALACSSPLLSTTIATMINDYGTGMKTYEWLSSRVSDILRKERVHINRETQRRTMNSRGRPVGGKKGEGGGRTGKGRQNLH
eukprot:7816598-Pyramimonas_sp.AAC.1